MKNISADLPANLKQRCQRYLTLQIQMKSGCARRPRSFIKIKLNLIVVLDISQIKRLPLAPLALQKKKKLLKEPFNESCEPSTTMIVEAPEYDSSDGLSSAKIANIEDEPPKRYR